MGELEVHGEWGAVRGGRWKEAGRLGAPIEEEVDED
jgi:hypothetical protein